MTKKHFIENFDNIIYSIENPKLLSHDEYLIFMYNLFPIKNTVTQRFKSEKWILDQDIILLIKLKNKEHLFEDIIRK
jgi:hypothetical protein